MFEWTLFWYSDIKENKKRLHETNKYRKSAKLFLFAMYADLCSMSLQMHFIVIFFAVISCISH
jgi:protein gp37